MRCTGLSSAALAALLVWATPVEAQRAVPREQSADTGGSSSDSGSRQPRAVPRGDTAPPSGGAVASRPSGGERSSASQDNGSQARGRSVPPYSRPRGDNTPTGEAVERRGGVPPRDRDRVIVPRGYYPWGYGGLGIGSYYGGYYDPWYYDPWYYGSYPPSYYSRYETGALRLKVKPREAEVYVDGYYAGRVDDFDGIFQRLRIEPGPHRIEIRADGFEPLVFEVRILPDHTISYEGELKPLP
jgi:hypothetical protein